MRVMADQIRVRVHLGERRVVIPTHKQTELTTDRMTESMHIYYRSHLDEFQKIQEEKKRAKK